MFLKAPTSFLIAAETLSFVTYGFILSEYPAGLGTHKIDAFRRHLGC